jgi:hypothetical protein
MSRQRERRSRKSHRCGLRTDLIAPMMKRSHGEGGQTVTKQINYEDDLFALNLMVRNLLDIVRLDADPAYFKDKLASDIFAIDAILARISDALDDCGTFVKRSECLRELAKLKKTFGNFLDEALLGRTPLSQALADYTDKLRRIRDAQGRDEVRIRETLARAAANPQELEHMVSEEEFKSLLETENQL